MKILEIELQPESVWCPDGARMHFGRETKIPICLGNFFSYRCTLHVHDSKGNRTDFVLAKFLALNYNVYSTDLILLDYDSAICLKLAMYIMHRRSDHIFDFSRIEMSCHGRSRNSHMK